MLCFQAEYLELVGSLMIQNRRFPVLGALRKQFLFKHLHYQSSPSTSKVCAGCSKQAPCQVEIETHICTPLFALQKLIFSQQHQGLFNIYLYLQEDKSILQVDFAVLPECFSLSSRRHLLYPLCSITLSFYFF